jgi:hypothetical protein
MEEFITTIIAISGPLGDPFQEYSGTHRPLFHVLPSTRTKTLRWRFAYGQIFMTNVSAVIPLLYFGLEYSTDKTED